MLQVILRVAQDVEQLTQFGDNRGMGPHEVDGRLHRGVLLQRLVGEIGDQHPGQAAAGATGKPTASRIADQLWLPV